jgi:hypothetical protein
MVYFLSKHRQAKEAAENVGQAPRRRLDYPAERCDSSEPVPFFNGRVLASDGLGRPSYRWLATAADFDGFNDCNEQRPLSSADGSKRMRESGTTVIRLPP